MKLNLILLSVVLLDATYGSALKKEKDRLVRHNNKSKKISLDGTKAASSSSVRGDNPEKPSSRETHNLRKDDGGCPVFTHDPYGNEDLTKKMLDAVKPCGTYAHLCKHWNYEVIRANVAHPGVEAEGDLDFKPYIVQFDIGVHSKIKDKVKATSEKGDTPLTDGTIGEQCLEIIVKGGSKATGGCAGKCGSSCSVLNGGYAKDCLKHDVCAAYKALKLGGKHWEQDDGFCYDIDCGDEAAQTIFNCYIDYWFNDKSITCDKYTFYHNKDAYGHWSYSTKFFSEGPCHNFVGWKSGQGIPNKSRISNPYRFLSRAAHHD